MVADDTVQLQVGNVSTVKSKSLNNGMKCDNNGPMGEGQTRFHRIERCATVYSQENKGESKPKTVPPVIKKRSHPPHVPPPL